MVERKYPTRTRHKPRNEVDGTLEPPISTVSKALAQADTKRAANKRIPALTNSRTFGQKSPIVDADIQGFLARCMSLDHWDRYTDQEKQDILDSLPPTYRFRQDGSKSEQLAEADHTRDPPVSQGFCEGDKQLKQAVARFKRDLSDGYYETAWLNKAKLAHEERLEGKFDEYIKQHTAEMFVDDEEELAESFEDTDDGSYEGPRGGRLRKAKKSC